MATCVIIMEENLFSALNPLKWIGILVDIRADSIFATYFFLQTTTLIFAYIAIMVDLGFFNLISMMIFVLVGISLFRSLGVALHSNADTLGISIRYGKKIEEAQLLRADEIEISNLLMQVYQLAHSGQTKKAWSMLEHKIQSKDHKYEAEIFERIQQWNNSRLALKTGTGFIERLVKRGDFRTAWHVLEYCFEANGGSYRLQSSDTVQKLLLKVETRNQKLVIAALLYQFPDDFPNHPQTPKLLLRAAQISENDLDDFASARRTMASLRSEFPEHCDSEAFKKLASILTK
ncbi:MAG: hypothetical protein VB957_15825 [Pseudomonadales bacterium]